jgi:formate dehydrogenase (coenzyme F420) beta subunit
MSTTWVLRTKSDPLGALQNFLWKLQEQAKLQGYVLPRYQSDGQGINPELVEDPLDLYEADPFAPLVKVNAAKTVAQVDQAHPEARFGAVLRSCEIRALKIFAQRELVHMDRWLVIGVDCLSSFPASDLEWRIQRAGSIKQMTHDALRFARQGGIAHYRYRRGCQMCVSPEPPDADLSIHVLGLPVKDYLLVQVRDNLAQDIHIDEITDGPASQYKVSNSKRLRNSVKKRRMAVRLQAIDNLPIDLPQEASGWLELLASCIPCQRCLDACPIYAGELDAIGTDVGDLNPEAKLWLASCLACGMCEDACPNHLPLTAIKSRIAWQLIRTKVAS